jgi:hypothetical protein
LRISTNKAGELILLCDTCLKPICVDEGIALFTGGEQPNEPVIVHKVRCDSRRLAASYEVTDFLYQLIEPQLIKREGS